MKDERGVIHNAFLFILPPSAFILSPVDRKEPLSHHAASTILNAALEQPQDRWLCGVGVVEARALPERWPVLPQHALDNAFKQRMSWPHEF